MGKERTIYLDIIQPNNVFDFLESEGYIRLKADACTSSKELYEIYKMWCEENSLNMDMVLRIETELYLKRLIVGVEGAGRGTDLKGGQDLSLIHI